MDLDIKTRDKEIQVSCLDKKRLIYCFFLLDCLVYSPNNTESS